MVSESSTLLILDDKSSIFTYGGGQWTISTISDWFEGTSVYPAFTPGLGDVNGSFGSISLEFNGTSIAFYGNTAVGTIQTVNITIDNNTPYISSYDDPDPPSYRQWYQSPTLADGPHRIVIENIDGTSLDYAIVTAGKSNQFTGASMIVVDDDDQSLDYSGSWRRNRERFDTVSLPDGFPFHNGTHETSNPGDSVTFRFSGTAIAIYGIFSWSTFGLLITSYTLDGATTPQSYTVSSSSQRFIDGGGQQSNFLLYSTDTLDTSDHTMTINITRCENMTFSLDYITYKPNFISLATMPDFGSITTQATFAGTHTPSATHSSPVPTIGIQETPSSAHSPHCVRVVVGGVIGGVVGSLLLFSILYLWRRHKFDVGDKLYPSGDNSQLIIPFGLGRGSFYQSQKSFSNFDASLVVASNKEIQNGGSGQINHGMARERLSAEREPERGSAFVFTK